MMVVMMMMPRRSLTQTQLHSDARKWDCEFGERFSGGESSTGLSPHNSPQSSRIRHLTRVRDKEAGKETGGSGAPRTGMATAPAAPQPQHGGGEQSHPLSPSHGDVPSWHRVSGTGEGRGNQ